MSVSPTTGVSIGDSVSNGTGVGSDGVSELPPITSIITVDRTDITSDDTTITADET